MTFWHHDIFHYDKESSINYNDMRNKLQINCCSQSAYSSLLYSTHYNYRHSSIIYSITMYLVAPKELSETVACKRKSLPPCSRANCSCRSANVLRRPSSYCKCEAKKHCSNVHTNKVEHAVATDEEGQLDEPLEEEESEAEE